MSERAQQRERNTASRELIESENQKMNGRGRAQKAPRGRRLEGREKCLGGGVSICLCFEQPVGSLVGTPE